MDQFRSLNKPKKDRQIEFVPAKTNVLKPGKGLVNMGNTCFLNAVMQCLAYSPVFNDFMVHKKHSAQCQRKSTCIACKMEQEIVRLFNGGQTAFRPMNIISSMKRIAPKMRIGRQEDAHEFLRELIESIHKSAQIKAKVEKSFVYDIFQGRLQSTVTCLKCKRVSKTVEPLLDLSLEINNCKTLEQAFHKFTAPELLNKGNKYRCEKCQSLQDAQKKISIEIPPPSLTVHLKRFGFMSWTSKITNHVAFKEELTLDPYLANQQKAKYHLTGVLVHSGQTCNTGHYYSYIRAHDGWFCADDESVTKVSLKTVLSKSAYMLFYTRSDKEAPVSSNSVSKTVEKKPVTLVVPKQPEETPLSPPKEILKANATDEWQVAEIAPPVLEIPKPKIFHRVIENELPTPDASVTSWTPPPENEPFSTGISGTGVSAWNHLATKDVIYARKHLLDSQQKKRKRPTRDDMEYDRPKRKF